MASVIRTDVISASAIVFALALGGVVGVLNATEPSGTSRESVLAEHRLESPPVFDGLAVAGGRLYLATVDGEVLCFHGR